MFSLSIIVPTYSESANIEELVDRIDKACVPSKFVKSYEIIIVDDYSGANSDETVRIVNDLKNKKIPISIHVRKTERGLSSAVMFGFSLARHDILFCMDADLQHEPESIPSMVEQFSNSQAEFVLGSRNVEGGGIGFEWSFTRRMISWGANSLAMGLTNCSDPMSGYFAVRKDVLKQGLKSINPVGFKIALEIICRCGVKRVHEVPITFRSRAQGESKLTMRQNVLYAKQLLALYYSNFKYIFIIGFLLPILMVLYYIGLN